MVMAADPQCVFYLAGADPYEDDQLGGLRLTQRRPARARSAGDSNRARRRRAARGDARRRLRAARRGHGRDPRRRRSRRRSVGDWQHVTNRAPADSQPASGRRRSSDRRSRRRAAIAPVVSASRHAPRRLDVFVLVGLVRRVRRRRPQVRQPEEDQLLVAEAGRGKDAPSRSTRPGTRPISSSHSRAAAASADSPASRLPAGSSHESRSTLGRYCRTRITRPIVGHRDQHDRRPVPDDRRPRCSRPFGKRRGLDLDREHAALRTQSALTCRSTVSAVLQSASCARAARRARAADPRAARCRTPSAGRPPDA